MSTKKIKNDLIGTSLTIGGSFDRELDQAIRRFYVRLPTAWEAEAKSFGITTAARYAIHLARGGNGEDQDHPESETPVKLRRSEARQIGYLTYEVKSYYYFSRGSTGGSAVEQRLKFRPISSGGFKAKTYRSVRNSEGNVTFDSFGLPAGEPLIDVNGPFEEAVGKGEVFNKIQYSLGVSFEIDAVTQQGALSNLFNTIGYVNSGFVQFYGVQFAAGSLLFSSITMDQIRDGNLKYVGTYNFIFCPQTFATQVLLDRSDNAAALGIVTVASGGPQANYPIFPGTLAF